MFVLHDLYMIRISDGSCNVLTCAHVCGFWWDQIRDWYVPTHTNVHSHLLELWKGVCSPISTPSPSVHW